MFLTPIYMAMTFLRSWRMRSFRARLLELLGGDTSVAFCRVPENAAETPTLSSKLCTNPNNAHLCDLMDYTNRVRVCSMKPPQSVELRDWIACTGGLPFGSGEFQASGETLDLAVLLECEMEQADHYTMGNFVPLESIGSPVAWKAGTHLALVVKTNIEYLTMAGFNFVGGEFIIDHDLPVVRIQTVELSGEPNQGTDPSMRSLKSDIQCNLKKPVSQFHWNIHSASLRKMSKVVDLKTDRTISMNGTSNLTAAKKISLSDVSVNTVPTASSDIGTATENGTVISEKNLDEYKNENSLDIDNTKEIANDPVEKIKKLPKAEAMGANDTIEKIKKLPEAEAMGDTAISEISDHNKVTVELKHQHNAKEKQSQVGSKKRNATIIKFAP